MRNLYTVLGKTAHKTHESERTPRSSFAKVGLTLLFFLVLSLSNLFSQTQTLSATTAGYYTWTCPVGVTSVTVSCYGGGGAGTRAAGNNQPAGGGGGGAFAQSTITVVPGQVYNIYVGSGGASGNPAGAGQDSFFDTPSVVMAKGGSANANGVLTGASGGAASASVGTLKYSGGNGGTGSGTNAGAGGGAAGPTGNGGNGGTGATVGLGITPGGNGGAGRTGTNGNGAAGVTYGGGGGGALRTTLISSNGGAGASGAVIITYNGTLSAITSFPSNNIPTSGSLSIPCGTSTYIYDNGGSAGNYLVNSDGTIVLNNTVGSTSVITLSGTFSGIETCCDYFQIYSGVGTGGTLLATYGPSGSGTISTIVTGAGQALTIRFYSDVSAVGAGINLTAIYSGSCAATSCSGTPSPGNTLTSSTSVASGGTVNLSLQNATSGTGVTYQWQSAPTSTGSWTNISGATASTYTATVSATTWYRCIVTCSGNNGTSNPTQVLALASNNIPTTGSLSIACGTNTAIFDNGGSAGNYLVNSDGTIVLNNTAGSTSVITLSGTFSGIETCCDYFQIYSGVGTGGTLLATYGSSGSGTISTIVTGAGQALTIRFYSDVSAVGAGINLTAIYSGSCTPPACTGAPAPGNTVTSSATTTSGGTVNLSLQNTIIGTGVTYQWQSAPTSTGTWTNISGATAATYTATVTANTWYQCIVTCSGNNGTSNPVQVSLTYCTPTSNCSMGDVIASVVLNTLSNTTGTACSTAPAGYSNFTGNPLLTTTLQPSQSYTVTVGAAAYAQSVAVWIDYNDDLVFDNVTERVGSTAAASPVPANGTASFTISLGCNPPAGVHRMRIRSSDNNFVNGPAQTPCTNYSYGETEDYLITISAPPACPSPGLVTTITPTTTTATVTWATNCASSTTYDIQYGPAGFTLGTGTILTNQTVSISGSNASFTLTGLNSGTAYNVYYRANCGGGVTSSWSVSNAFSTVCAPTGDQITYGAGSWIGYVYDAVAAGDFSTYKGVLTEATTFNRTHTTIAAGATASHCSTNSDLFSIRYKNTTNFPAGYFTFTIGGDDGVRLSLDGGSTWHIGAAGAPIAGNSWNNQSYTQYSSATPIFLSGNTDMVFEYFENTGGAQSSFSYIFTPACSGTPTPGNTLASATAVVSGGTTNLSLQNSTAPATYVWQSATSSTGPWTTIAGATNPTYTATVSATTWYQCVVTCTASGLSATSNPIQVVLFNDNCSDATPMACGSTVTVNTAAATTDAIGSTTCGTTITTPGVWYLIAGTGAQMTVSTVGLTTVDTKIIVYSGTCAGLTCVGGSDDFSGAQSSVSWNSVAGTNYYVLAATYSGTGSFPMSLSCVSPPAITSISASPACQGETVTITGTGFTNITSVQFNGVNAASYIVNSATSISAVIPATATTGNVTVTNALGSSGLSLTINSAPSAPTVSATTSTFCGTGGTTALTASGSTGTYSWSAVEGGPTLSNTSGSSISATVTQTSAIQVVGTGGSCPSIAAVISIGVYPLPGATMSTNAINNAVCIGGTVNVNSGLAAGNFSSTSITHAPKTAPVNATTICAAGVGNPAPQGIFGTSYDDGGWANIPIGFTFDFFGANYSTLNVGTNGNVMFGAFNATSLADFTFTGLPSTTEPFNMVAVLAMDNDLAGTTGGSVKYWTEGFAPNRRFVISYENVKEFGDNQFSTSQAIFYETTGVIEVHVTSSTNADRVKVVGVNNGAGTIGVQALAQTSAITTPVAYRFTPPADYTTQWYANGVALGVPTTNGFTLTNQTPTANTTYSIDYTNQVTGCSNDPANAAISVVVNALPTVSAGLDKTICIGNEVTLTGSGASTYTWNNSVTNGTAFVPTATTTYTVTGTDVNGCSNTDQMVVNLPTAGTAISTNGESATCAVSQNGWVNFYNLSSGRLVASINSQGYNLGNVTITSYVDPTNELVPACSNPNPIYSTSVMQRHWVITPENNPPASAAANILVRFPFSDGEFNALNFAAFNNANTNDNVGAVSDIKLSKYSNGSAANVNSSALDNCGVGTTTIHTQVASGTGTLNIAYPQIASTTGQYVTFQIPSFSEFWLHGSALDSPLPVELVNFQANCAGEGKVEVTWATASEHNSANFTVEKSRDGMNWTVMASLAGAGNSTQMINYSTVDNNAASGVNYYRLTQTDFDGASETFNIASANCEDNSSLTTVKVYPNPSAGDFYIDFTSEEITGSSVITITDARGVVVYNMNVTVEKGNNVFHIDNMEAAPGMYYIQVSNGTNTSNIVKHSLR